MLPSLLYVKPREPKPAPPKDWCSDLDAAAVVDAMAGTDAYLQSANLAILSESMAALPEDIAQRQEAMRDAVARPEAFEALYSALAKGISKYEETYRASQPGYARFMSVVERIRGAAAMMGILLELAGAIRAQFHPGKARFASNALRGYGQAFLAFFDEAFLREAQARRVALSDISDGSRVVIGAAMGSGLKGSTYRIRRIEPYKKSGRLKTVDFIPLESHALQIKAIELRDGVLRGVLFTANAVNQQMLDIFSALRREIGFYAGGARLHKRMHELGLPIAWPKAHPAGRGVFRFDSLADIGLALRTGQNPVANTLYLDGKRLIAVTGANQGGKSTFLRSVGLAQIMMQAGLFVAANLYESDASPCVFMHFTRAEDGAMDSGKLDEELKRLDRIVDAIEPYGLLLMNESFASTTEREGSAIAREITRAMHALHVRVIFVTHLYDYARSLGESGLADTAVLRAERGDDGSRSFIIREGIALPTSFGLDLYERIIGDI